MGSPDEVYDQDNDLGLIDLDLVVPRKMDVAGAIADMARRNALRAHTNQVVADALEALNGWSEVPWVGRQAALAIIEEGAPRYVQLERGLR